MTKNEKSQEIGISRDVSGELLERALPRPRFHYLLSVISDDDEISPAIYTHNTHTYFAIHEHPLIRRQNYPVKHPMKP